jgi:hypothetical protein
MVLAKEAGYTKVISIETYTNHYYALIWFIGEKRVTIRCVKEEDTEKAVSPVFSDMEE